jgi:hypothetical protein
MARVAASLGNPIELAGDPAERFLLDEDAAAATAAAQAASVP